MQHKRIFKKRTGCEKRGLNTVVNFHNYLTRQQVAGRADSLSRKTPKPLPEASGRFRTALRLWQTKLVRQPETLPLFRERVHKA